MPRVQRYLREWRSFSRNSTVTAVTSVWDAWCVVKSTAWTHFESKRLMSKRTAAAHTVLLIHWPTDETPQSDPPPQSDWEESDWWSLYRLSRICYRWWMLRWSWDLPPIFNYSRRPHTAHSHNIYRERLGIRTYRQQRVISAQSTVSNTVGVEVMGWRQNVHAIDGQWLPSGTVPNVESNEARKP